MSEFDGYESLDDSVSEEAILDWFRSIRPKNFVTMVNPKKYAEFQSAVFTIKSAIDECCKQTFVSSGDIKYKVLQAGLRNEKVLFLVYLPGDGFVLKRDLVSKVYDGLPDGTQVSVSEASDGYVLFCFAFRDIQAVISSD